MLPPWVGAASMVLLSLATAWGVVLAWRLARRQRAVVALMVLIAAALPLAAWAVELFVWRPA